MRIFDAVTSDQMIDYLNVDVHFKITHYESEELNVRGLSLIPKETSKLIKELFGLAGAIGKGNRTKKKSLT